MPDCRAEAICVKLSSNLGEFVYHNYLIIGLTGGFGTGKTTVADIFREAGAYIIDADELARASLQQGTREYQEVISTFGKEVLNRDGEINRKALSNIVFPDPEKLSRLNGIIHPGVIREIKEGMRTARQPIRIAVIPLLFETGLENGFDYVIVVKADKETAADRIITSRNVSRDEICLRRQAQLPLEEKIKKADFIIDNNGTIEETREQVELIRKKLIQELVRIPT